MNIEIGMKYIPRSDKHKRIHTVEDVLKTYNSAGDLVNTRYRCSHEFCRQKVFDNDVVQPTIARGLTTDRF